MVVEIGRLRDRGLPQRMFASRSAGIVASCRCHYAFHLFALKWLGQHVVAPAIQDLRPKLLIRRSRRHDQLWRMRPGAKAFQQLFPIPVRNIATSNHNLHGIAVQVSQSFLLVTRLQQSPSGIPKDLVYYKPLIFVLTDQ